MDITREQFFATLSHHMRLRTLLLLQQEGELCVCDLTRILKVAQPAMSRQLGILREEKIVQARRDGLWMYYRINSELPPWAVRLIEQIFNDIGTDEPYRGDRLAVSDKIKMACTG